MDGGPATRPGPGHPGHRRPGDRQRTTGMSDGKGGPVASALGHRRVTRLHRRPGSDGAPTGGLMEIDTLEGVRLGGITQWIRVRGADASNPVLLLMQQGPGLPMINDTRRFERELRLEDDFTVVYWDQRGTGLSAPGLGRRSDRYEISVARMVDDTVALLELLLERFGGKPFVTGFSFGATFAAYAAARRPELVAALVAGGMDVDTPAAENHAYAFALDVARRRGNPRAIRQLEAIGPPPHTNVKQFTARARW